VCLVTGGSAQTAATLFSSSGSPLKKEGASALALDLSGFRHFAPLTSNDGLQEEIHTFKGRPENQPRPARGQEAKTLHDGQFEANQAPVRFASRLDRYSSRGCLWSRLNLATFSPSAMSVGRRFLGFLPGIVPPSGCDSESRGGLSGWPAALPWVFGSGARAKTSAGGDQRDREGLAVERSGPTQRKSTRGRPHRPRRCRRDWARSTGLRRENRAHRDDRQSVCNCSEIRSRSVGRKSPREPPSANSEEFCRYRRSRLLVVGRPV
jgi:hypothetical protein